MKDPRVMPFAATYDKRVMADKAHNVTRLLSPLDEFRRVFRFGSVCR